MQRCIHVSMSKSFYDTKTHSCGAETTCADHKILSFTELAHEQSRLWWKSSLDHRFRHRLAPEILHWNRIWCLNLSEWVSEKKTQKQTASQEVTKCIYKCWKYLYQQENRSQTCHRFHHSCCAFLYTTTQSYLLHPQDNRQEASPNLFYSCWHIPITADELTLPRPFVQLLLWHIHLS